MSEIFSPSYDNSDDLRLLKEANGGSNQSLNALVKKHQHYIYNIALRYILDPIEAEDLTQEVLIKVITKLSSFEGRSNFRTWLYRITVNHFLSTRKTALENYISDFDTYGNQLTRIKDSELNIEDKIAKSELIEKSKLSCMTGMLLCLSREQRIVYIIGEIFEADHNVGSELLDITPSNFRKRLQRARQDLYQFMNNKCGLIKSENPCRCHRKTNGFIKAGWVDPSTMKFNTDYTRSIIETIRVRNNDLDDVLAGDYKAIFQSSPFQEKNHSGPLLESITLDKDLKKIFNL